MRVDIYSDFTLKDILQSYSSVQFSECIRDAGDIQLSFTDSEVYRNIKVMEDFLVVENNAYLAENKHKTDNYPHRSPNNGNKGGHADKERNNRRVGEAENRHTYIKQRT